MYKSEVRHMDELGARAARFDSAVLLLPHGLRERARRLTLSERASCEELRLRTGRPLTAVTPAGERPLGGEPVTAREIDALLDIATGASAYSAKDSMRCGYLTVRGGFRIGLCGTVLLREGRAAGFKTVTSAAIRIARQIRDAADPVMGELCRDGAICSTLVVSPPGGGKTTLLRELVRRVSDGEGAAPMRVALVDERSELAALFDGRPCMDVGSRTDVLDSCPRAEGILMLLRAMNPQVIAFDEITAPEDCAAAEAASRCGVRLLAAAHADSPRDLREKTAYRSLFENGVFEKAAVIRLSEGRRQYRVLDAEEVLHGL